MARPKSKRSPGLTTTTRLEADTGALHAAEVQHAYVALLKDQLPESVFAELDTLPMTPEAIEGWAGKHGINTECVMKEFAVYCNGGWTKYGKWGGSTWWSPQTPQEWRARVAELNAMGVAGDALYGREDQLLVDESLRGADGHFHFPGIKLSTVHEAIVRHARPISADPSLEPLEEFLLRARRHWLARAKEAARHGLSPSTAASAWGNLARDLQWLYWRDVERQTVDEIRQRWANEHNEHVTADSVKKAVRQLSKVLGLPSRRPGRPTNQK